MAVGDIILSDGTFVTPEDLQRIATAVTALIASTQKDPGQYEEISSLQGVTSLPVFQASGAVFKLVRVAVSILKGMDGKEIHLQSTATHLQWRWTDGMWTNLIAWADLKGDTGETPAFRTGASGIEWKYQGEPDTAWKVLVSYNVLKLKFTDLTPGQIAEFWRQVPADVVALFQQPATEAAAEVRDAMAQIVQDVSQVIGATNTAKDAANTAAGNANTKASLANSAATAANTAKDNANTAAGRVDTAITNATTAANTANTAAGSVDTAKTAATNAATAANKAAGLANTATTNANTEAGKATTAAGLANTNAGLADTAAERANTAAEAAESVVSGIRPDWAELNSGSSNYIANKPVLKPVATSGSYNDLSNKPTIPAAYTHPAFTARTSGLYKITVNNQGHVTEVVAVSKADITNLGIPAQDTNTTYSPATAAVDGLMSKADKSKIDGVAASANNYTHPTGAGYTHIPTGGAAGQYLKWLASGTAVWAADNNTTYNVVTTTVDGLMSAADKKRVDYSYGRNDIATLLNLPVTKRTITATLSGATSLSLSTALEEGQELLIRCVPSAAFTQPLPNVGGWTSMSGASFAATANKPFEISIWCYKTGYYSAVVKEQD